MPKLIQLNLSNNLLYGQVPESLLQKFGNESFSGNEELCGASPFPECSRINEPPLAASNQTVESSPTSPGKKSKRKGLSPGAIVAIVIATAVVIVVVIYVIVACYCGRYSRDSNVGSESGKKRTSYGSEKKVFANNGGGDSDGTSASDKSKLVFFDRKKQFELEDLLKASAEMLGKGSLGTVYRAVLDDGIAVAVI
ncbi:putative leucine-rich repeat receptor-like protein kinase [Heracleum sosnowskyi]|uniref:Leucine-rich repeat receptor-like protein kinase n=1 Tax=Heracleum sosnowskyi TaxID=360622 RepID=A0AAD8N2Q5_9APIA|nr:putative leucine-rich repeat receptor-like protein kinase [Heracleum sosnowskyi]